MATIASSATSVLIAHVAAQTRTIRLGAGGIMLPNHAPLTIAEQFGTLETLHPGRIDLGLGRAPGSDQDTMRALRRYVTSADTLPRRRPRAAGLPERRNPHRRAWTRRRARVPTSRCTSSAPPCSGPTSPRYLGCRLPSPPTSPRTTCKMPSRRTDASSARPRNWSSPYVIAGVNVIAADTTSEARQQHLTAKRNRVRSRLGRGQTVTDEEADMLLELTRGPARPAHVQVRRRRHASRGQ